MTPVERHDVRLVVGDCLALVLHRPAARARVPCIIACHGLRASKDSDKYLLLGEELPRAGLALARFDFRGCGESTGRPDDLTVGRQVEECEAVLAFLERHPGLDGRFGLLGSSMGGFVAVHVAHRRQDGLPVVTWNTPASLVELAKDAETVREAALGPAFLEEFHGGRFAAAPRGLRRHLVVQGDADDVVALEHGVQLHAQAGEPRRLHVVPGGDHRLTDPVHRQEAVAASLAWLLRFLPL